MKKILILTKDIEDWSFEIMNREDVVRKVSRRPKEVILEIEDGLEITLLESWWRDNYRGKKYNYVVLDMSMELRDWQQFRCIAIDGVRFGEKANFLQDGRRTAPICGGTTLGYEKPGERYVSFK